VVFPRAHLFVAEPELDLFFGGLDCVRPVADVSADVDAEVATDGSGARVGGLGGAEHLSAGGDNVVAVPDHGANGARAHVLDESGEEALLGKIGVVLLHVPFSGGAELHGNQLEALLLEALNDFSNETTLDTIGLDHDERAFLGLVKIRLQIHFPIASGLEVFKHLGIVFKLPLDSENVSELLDTSLTVLVVLDGKAVLFLGFSVHIETSIVGLFQPCFVAFFVEFLAEFFSSFIHSRRLPNCFGGSARLFISSFHSNSVLRDQQLHINMDLDNLDVG